MHERNCYAGLEIKNLVESRVRLYKKRKPIEQAILAIDHQLYYWLRFDTKEIDVGNQHGEVWMVGRKGEWSCHTSIPQRYLSVSTFFSKT